MAGGEAVTQVGTHPGTQEGNELLAGKRAMWEKLRKKFPHYERLDLVPEDKIRRALTKREYWLWTCAQIDKDENEDRRRAAVASGWARVLR